MRELTYNKEVSYEFTYNGDVYYEYHYRNNILDRRFRVYNNDIETRRPIPLSFKSTGSNNLSIKATLIAERILFQSEASKEKRAELIYLLPDVNQYLIISYEKEQIGEDEFHVQWSVQYL